MTDYLVPIVILAAALASLRKQENCYDHLLQGCQEGLQVLLSIVPSLILLLTAVYMLRASGAMLVLIRPISGSAALAVGAELMACYGVDSQIGRTVAVMLGSTETTFYIISVYFGAVGIKKTRYAIPAALFADFVGFFTASLTARLL